MNNFDVYALKLSRIAIFFSSFSYPVQPVSYYASVARRLSFKSDEINLPLGSYGRYPFFTRHNWPSGRLLVFSTLTIISPDVRPSVLRVEDRIGAASRDGRDSAKPHVYIVIHQGVEKIHNLLTAVSSLVTNVDL